MIVNTPLVESDYIRVQIKYSGPEYSKMFKWCFDNCVGNFYDTTFSDTVHFYFDNEQDAVHFSLTWF